MSHTNPTAFIAPIAIGLFVCGCHPHAPITHNVVDSSVQSELTGWEAFLQSAPDIELQQLAGGDSALVRIATYRDGSFGGLTALFVGEYMDVFGYLETNDEAFQLRRVTIAESARLVHVKTFRERDVVTLLAPKADCQNIESWKERSDLFLSFIHPDDFASDAAHLDLFSTDGTQRD